MNTRFFWVLFFLLDLSVANAASNNSTDSTGRGAIASTAQPCQFDYSKMSAFIDSVRTSGSAFESYVQSLERSQPDKAKETALPKWSQDFFKSLQSTLFGSFRPLRLVGIKNYDNASYNARTRSVEFGIPFFQSVQSYPGIQKKTSVAEFIIAHEVGHLLLDYAVSLSPNKDTTLNGYNMDAEESLSADFAEIEEALDKKEIDQIQAQEKKFGLLKLLSCPHAEVDAFGYLALSKMKKPFPEDSYLFFSQGLLELDPQTENGLVFSADLKARLEMAQRMQRSFKTP